ncbi:putative nucleoporin [Smittium mucronatum]|uniref:Putative nucleoporin n=1 Tax=Smittium mucronatum TaxID=133383 RepID=A0A1R0H003_9FUNG|nr:putative nucleoporin [Smittium mucronatum]
MNRIYENPNSTPETLELVHVRKANINNNENLTIHTGLYFDYATLLANVKDDDCDEILCSNIDNSAIQQSMFRHGKSNLTECSSVVKIEGKTWAISPIGERKAEYDYDLCTIDYSSRSKIALLTNTGINILAKQSPLDMILWLVSKGPIIDIEANLIIEGYGRSEMCSMCLTILSSDDTTQRSLSVNAIKNCTTLFFEYGGVPYIRANVAMASQLVGKSSEPQIVFSGRHDGLYLFISRILIGIWETPVLKLVNLKENQTYLTFSHSPESLLTIQSRLIRLQTFINRNQRFIPQSAQDSFSIGSESLISDSFNMVMGKNNEACWKLEADSLFGAYSLIQQVIETISFLKIIMGINVNLMASEVDNSIKSELCKASFSDISTSQHIRKICRDLVISVVGSRISHSESVESISEALGSKCGSFFNGKDIKLYRAFEYLRIAQKLFDSNSDFDQQQSLLQECLEMFTESGILIGEKKLKQCVSVFMSFNWSVGALMLCLGCAKNSDPNDLAFDYYNNTILLDSGIQKQGLKLEDSAKSLYEWRLFCYKLALLLIKPENGEINNKLFQVALNFNDILFHINLYDYLLSSKAESILSQVQTPFLIDYLKSNPVSLEKYDLLWRHYAYFSNFSQASIILHELALGTVFKEITLTKRMEYLSLAISNAKSSLHYEKDKLPVSFLNQMTDQLKTAQIQMEIVIVLSSRPDQDASLNLLNSRLFNVTELYDQFAQPLNLYEQILLLYRLSNFTDRVQIFAIWNHLIYKTFLGKISEDSQFDYSNDNLIAVSSKISSLGSRLHPSDSAFPLDLVSGILIILTLKVQNPTNSDEEDLKFATNSGFVTQVLLDSNVQCVVINDIICSYLNFLLSGSGKDIISPKDFKSSDSDLLLNSPLEILKSCIILSLGASSSEDRPLDDNCLKFYSRKNIVSVLLMELLYLYRKWISFSSSEMIYTEGDPSFYEDNAFPAISVTSALSKYVLMTNGFINGQVTVQIQQLQNEIHSLY